MVNFAPSGVSGITFGPLERSCVFVMIQHFFDEVGSPSNYAASLVIGLYRFSDLGIFTFETNLGHVYSEPLGRWFNFPRQIVV